MIFIHGFILFIIFFSDAEDFAVKYVEQIKFGSIKDALIDAACKPCRQSVSPATSSSFDSLRAYQDDQSSVSSEGEYIFSQNATNVITFSKPSTPSQTSDAKSQASTVPFESVRQLRSPIPIKNEAPLQVVVGEVEVPRSPSIVEMPMYSPRPETLHHGFELRAQSPDPYAPYEERILTPPQGDACLQQVYVPKSPPPLTYEEIERQHQQQQPDERLRNNPFAQLIETQMQREQNNINNIDGVWPQPFNNIEVQAVQMAQQMFFHLQAHSMQSMVMFDADPRMVTARMPRDEWDAFRHHQDIPARRHNQIAYFNRYIDALENGVDNQFFLDLAIGGPYNIFERR